MLEVIAVGNVSVIYLARAVKMLKLVRIEASNLQNGDSQKKRQQDEQQNDYACGYF